MASARRRRLFSTLVASILGLTLVTTGCTVPPPGAPAPVPGGPATIYPTGAQVPDLSNLPVSMTREQRSTAARSVTDAWSPQRTGDLQADATALLSVIARTPGFADAGLSADGSVWARFQDGRPLTWILTKDEDPKDQSPMPTPARSAVGIPRLQGLGGVPHNQTAVVLNWRNVGEIVTSTITPWLKDANYTLSPATNRVRDLMTKIKDVGVLHMATHGGIRVTPKGESRYILTTDDLWDGSNMSAEENANYEEYSQMWQDGLLVPVIIGDNILTHNFGDLYVWAITSSFVQKYWTLSADALVYFTACAYFETVESAEFNLAVKAAAADKNPTVIGWNHPVGVFYAEWVVVKYFARLLGNNSIDHEKIPRRPFTYKQVYDWMAEAGEVHDVRIRDATLLLFGDGELVPSVTKVNVLHPGPKSKVPHPGDWQVEITGSFGPDPGPDNRSVTISQTLLEVYPNDWSPGLIRAKLPPSMTGGPSYGDLAVEVRGHLSNIVPITQWTGTVVQQQTLHNTDDQGMVTFTCPVRITADVHPFRFQPRTEPRITFAAPMEVTSSCTYRMSGTWHPDKNRTCTLSGGGSFTIPADSLTQVVSMSQKWDPNATNHGELPPRVFVFPPQNDPGQAQGTITCRSPSGTNITTHDGVIFSGGSYWMNKPVGLQMGTYNVLEQTLDCNYQDAYAKCAEVWELTARGPIPDDDTPA